MFSAGGVSVDRSGEIAERARASTGPRIVPLLAAARRREALDQAQQPRHGNRPPETVRLVPHRTMLGFLPAVRREEARPLGRREAQRRVAGAQAGRPGPLEELEELRRAEVGEPPAKRRFARGASRASEATSSRRDRSGPSVNTTTRLAPPPPLRKAPARGPSVRSTAGSRARKEASPATCALCRGSLQIESKTTGASPEDPSDMDEIGRPKIGTASRRFSVTGLISSASRQVRTIIGPAIRCRSAAISDRFARSRQPRAEGSRKWHPDARFLARYARPSARCRRRSRSGGAPSSPPQRNTSPRMATETRPSILRTAPALFVAARSSATSRATADDTVRQSANRFTAFVDRGYHATLVENRRRLGLGDHR